MKRKGVFRHVFATVLFVSAISVCHVAWAAEVQAPTDANEQIATTNEAVATELEQGALQQPVDSTMPNEQANPQAPTTDNTDVKQPADATTEQAPTAETNNTDQTVDTMNPKVPTMQNNIDAPYMVTPTMEISKEKDSYQSYEVIYVALTAPEGYTIYYSLDGSLATATSTLYTQPFAIEAPGAAGGSVTLHAIAIKTSDTM